VSLLSFKEVCENNWTLSYSTATLRFNCMGLRGVFWWYP